jgi:hypothetical protein
VDQTDWLSAEATNVVRLLGLLIPLLTALLTKKLASQGLKAVVTLISSVLLGSIAYLVAADGGYDWEGFVNAFINAFLPAIAAYYGLWKPTGVAGTVANKTARFGVGSPPMLQTSDKGAESVADPEIRP